MSAKNDKNGSGTTSRILDVAERMLQVRGYNGFSYGDVAGELDITRAALHYHFKGKAELGQALIGRYAERFTAALAHLDATAPDAATKLRGYVALYTDVLSADRMCLCGMLAAEHRTLPDPLQQAVCAFFASNTAWLRRVLEEGCAEAGRVTLDERLAELGLALEVVMEGGPGDVELCGHVPVTEAVVAADLQHPFGHVEYPTRRPGTVRGALLRHRGPQPLDV